MLPGTAACMHFPEKRVLLCQWKAMLKFSAECWISGSKEQFSFQLLLHRELIRAEELEQSKPHRFQEGCCHPDHVPSWHNTQAAQRKHEEFAHCSPLCFEWKHRAQLHPSGSAEWLSAGGSTAVLQLYHRAAMVVSLVQNDFFLLSWTYSSDNCLFSFPPAITSRVCTKKNRSNLGCQGKNLELETNIPWRYKEGNIRSSITK